nr:hypothetical protein [Tanacetum cinerariifolium]
MPYEVLEDDKKNKLGKNNEPKMTIYNSLPRKEYQRVIMCKTAKEVWHTLIITHQGNSQVRNFKIDLLTQEYEKFLISNEENIDRGFTRFNVIVTSLKSLDPDYSSKNHVRKFLCALPLKWRAKVYEMVLDNDNVAYEETKLMKEMPYEVLEDDKKNKLGKNNEPKMTIYNSLPRKEYQRVIMCKTAKEVWHTLIITHQGNSQVRNFKIDLLTQEYEKFLISNEENIDRGFTRFNVIVTSLKSLDPDYSSKNHVRKFLCALPLKWRAKVKSLALKAKVTRDQTSDDSNSQNGCDEDIDEEEAEAFNLLARNFRKFFHKGNRFGRGNRFAKGGNRFGKGHGNSFGNNGGESSKQKG